MLIAGHSAKLSPIDNLYSKKGFFPMRAQTTIARWNEEYQRVTKLTERRNALFGIWDGANKVAWACKRVLQEYEGRTNYDVKFADQLRLTMEMAQAKVSQLDPEIARIHAEINQRLEFLQNHEGLA